MNKWVDKMPKKKTKRDLWELAMIYRYDLGGFRYKKEYKPMVALAYMYNEEELKKLEKKNNNERKELNRKRVKYVKEHGPEWNMTINRMIIDISDNAGESLDIAYAQDLLKLHKEKYIYYSTRTYLCEKCGIKHKLDSKIGKEHLLYYKI